MSLLPLIIIFSVLSLSGAEDRPHGLPTGDLPAISPEEYKFFHPYSYPPAPKSTCHSYKCTPTDGTLPLAATVKSTPAQESAPATTSGLGAGCVAGVSLSLLFVCMVAMGAYFVIVRRRANSYKANHKLDLA